MTLNATANNLNLFGFQLHESINDKENEKTNELDDGWVLPSACSSATPLSSSTLHIASAANRQENQQKASDDGFSLRKKKITVMQGHESAPSKRKRSQKMSSAASSAIDSQLAESLPEFTIWTDENNNKCISIGGKARILDFMKEGTGHRVFQFRADESLTINGTAVKANLLIVKIPHYGKRAPETINRIIRNEEIAYVKMKALNVPLPEVYARHKGLTIYEKMAEEVSCDAWKGIQEAAAFEALLKSNPKAAKLLHFVKKWLTEFSKQEKILIGDLYRRNVMWNSVGELYCVDWEISDDPWECDLYGFAIAWANQSPAAFQFLISHFKQNVKGRMEAFLETQMKENAGKFPASANS